MDDFCALLDKRLESLLTEPKSIYGDLEQQVGSIGDDVKELEDKWHSEKPKQEWASTWNDEKVIDWLRHYIVVVYYVHLLKHFVHILLMVQSLKLEEHYYYIPYRYSCKKAIGVDDSGGTEDENVIKGTLESISTEFDGLKEVQEDLNKIPTKIKTYQIFNKFIDMLKQKTKMNKNLLGDFAGVENTLITSI